MKIKLNPISDKLPRRHSKVFLPPESLVYTGLLHEEIKIDVIQYDNDSFTENIITNVDDLKQFDFKEKNTWIQVYGLHDESVIKKIGDLFNIHNLVLEDILNIYQRPKLEDYDDYLFLVVKAFFTNDENMDITYKQISCILNDNILISFLEKQTNFFDPLKENIKNNRSNIRSKKPDFLLYNFLDLIIDSYFIILQEIEEKLGNIEDNLLEVNNNELTNQLHKLRTNISMLHRYIFPIVEITKNIETSNSKFINDIAFYYRDLYDHSYRIVESLENYREMTFNILQIYLSEVSTRMNEIMKMLTIIATIFIPLTFIVGVYGMNFKYMPELEYRYGYFIVWGVMIVIALLLIFYFKRKKWL